MMGGCLPSLILLSFLPFAAAAPLQWEQVQPVGEGPSARYAHGSSTCDAMQGAFFIFGGTPPALPAGSPLSYTTLLFLPGVYRAEGEEPTLLLMVYGAVLGAPIICLPERAPRGATRIPKRHGSCTCKGPCSFLAVRAPFGFRALR